MAKDKEGGEAARPPDDKHKKKEGGYGRASESSYARVSEGSSSYVRVSESDGDLHPRYDHLHHGVSEKVDKCVRHCRV